MAKPRHGGWTKRNKIGFMYVCIWGFGFLVFQLYPFISSLLYPYHSYYYSSYFFFPVRLLRNVVGVVLYHQEDRDRKSVV